MDEFENIIPSSLQDAFYESPFHPSQNEIVEKAIEQFQAEGNIAVGFSADHSDIIVAQAVCYEFIFQAGEKHKKILIIVPTEQAIETYLRNIVWLKDVRVERVDRAAIKSKTSMIRLVGLADVLLVTPTQVTEALRNGALRFSQMADEFGLLVFDEYVDPLQTEKFHNELNDVLLQSQTIQNIRTLILFQGDDEEKIKPWHSFDNLDVIVVKDSRFAKKILKQDKKTGSKSKFPWVREIRITFALPGFFERVLWIALAVFLVMFNYQLAPIEVWLERAYFVLLKVVPVFFLAAVLVLILKVIVSIIAGILNSFELSPEEIEEIEDFISQKVGAIKEFIDEHIKPRFGVKVSTQPNYSSVDGALVFSAKYKQGDDLLDESYSIDGPDDEFFGECGIGIAETVGTGETKNVTAFEVWMFDKNDLKTASSILMSKYAFSDTNLRDKLQAKGELHLAQKGGSFLLETKTLQATVKIVDMKYGQNLVDLDGDNQYFSYMMIEIEVIPNAQAAFSSSKNDIDNFVPISKVKPKPFEQDNTPNWINAIGSQKVSQLADEQNWQLPDVKDILESGSVPEFDEELIQQRARLIQETLTSFRAPVQVVEINRGPGITQFGVEPLFVETRSGRTKVLVSKIASLADDLALALAAPRIRIQAPVPGHSYVGIEVPNDEMTLVALRDIVESEPFKRNPNPMKFALGRDVTGHPVSTTLENMPHLLIAGTSGSGKSVCVNSILTCMLLHNTPDELKLILVDPKRKELTNYNGIPHLLAPVVVEVERVIGALQWVTREMDGRYHLFAQVGSRNINDYNAKMKLQGGKKLPLLVIVINELADLMMISPTETESTITRLAQLSRATGIHMVLATQRTSVDVVTGLIKANFPARIAFVVASNTDSRVILDQPGAERLLGRGDMLFQAPDAPVPVRLQGVFVSDHEVINLVDFWKAQLGKASPYAVHSALVDIPNFDTQFEQTAEIEGKKPEDQNIDPLFIEAVALVRKEGRASVSMLQRRFRIGYTRAARLVDKMEDRGIVGPPEGGTQMRQILDYGVQVSLATAQLEVQAEKVVEKKKPRQSRKGSKSLPPEFRTSLKVPEQKGKKAAPRDRDERLPSLNILLADQTTRSDERTINQTAGMIEKTLAEFGISTAVIGFRIGPTVTQFALQPGYMKKAGATEEEEKQIKVRMAQITSLQKDLALALSAERLRIEAPVPGKPYVVVEVPNMHQSNVHLRPLLETEDFSKIGAPLALALGRDVSGQPLVADLARMPHLLIAGATGSGKSICITSLAVCLVMNNPPEDLRMVMIDSKMVELLRFNGLPHLYGKVETNVDRILGVLRWVVVEMEHRYRLLEGAHARDLETYNRKLSRKKEGTPLPRIVVLIDELADLMMSAPDQTEHNLVRLAQMARATGIHLIVATQRPSTDVVTGLIKANFPARLAFAVTSGVDSRVILDTTGAENLLGRGDMLFLNPEVDNPVRAQGVFVTDMEIERVISHWQKNADASESDPPWEKLLKEPDENEDEGLIEQAVSIVRHSQRASASLLQRRLRIGYPRAARLLEQLEDMGVVGSSQSGGKERDVLLGPLDEDEYEEDPTEQKSTMHAVRASRNAEKTNIDEMRLTPPITQTTTTYVVGDDLYDETFSIDSGDGEFLGEYGVGVSETIGVGEPKMVAALEIWLFDKNDIKTATNVLMSEYAYNDVDIRSRLEPKGDINVVKSGRRVLLETETLQLLATVVDLEYGVGELPQNSYFKRITIELAIWPRSEN